MRTSPSWSVQLVGEHLPSRTNAIYWINKTNVTPWCHASTSITVTWYLPCWMILRGYRQYTVRWLQWLTGFILNLTIMTITCQCNNIHDEAVTFSRRWSYTTMSKSDPPSDSSPSVAYTCYIKYNDINSHNIRERTRVDLTTWTDPFATNNNDTSKVPPPKSYTIIWWTFNFLWRL